MTYRHLDHSSAGIYGCWIGPDNAVHPDCPVPVLHGGVIGDWNDVAPEAATNGKAYGLGFVQARFLRDSTLSLRGHMDDLNRTREQWMALAKAVSRIELVLVYEEAELGQQIVTEPVEFRYPDQEGELLAYLGASKERPLRTVRAR